MISEFILVVRQKFIQGQFVYIALGALIQEGLECFVKLDGMRRDNRLEFIGGVMPVRIALTRKIIGVANAIRITLFNGIDVHRIQSAPELGRTIANDFDKCDGRLRSWAIPVAKILSIAKASYQAVDSFIFTNKSGHVFFSFSKVQALTRLRFLSRETGLPNKSLRMKKKIPYSLDAYYYTHLLRAVKGNIRDIHRLDAGG
jgi:hypothetical protein